MKRVSGIVPHLTSTLLLMLAAGIARGQCDTVTNVEGYDALPGVNGTINAFYQWDYDSNTGPAPNLMVMCGTFNTAGNLSNLNGIVGWNGTAFVRLGSETDPNRPNGGLCMTGWDRDLTNQKKLIVADATGIHTFNGSAWTSESWASSSPGVHVTHMTTWDPDGSGPLRNSLVWVEEGGGFDPEIVRFDITSLVVEARVSSSTGSIVRVNSIDVWDPDGSGPIPNSLVVGGKFNRVEYTTPVNNVTYLVRDPAFRQNGTFANGLNNEVTAVRAWDRGGPIKAVAMGGLFTGPVSGGTSNGLIFWNGSSYSGFTSTHTGITQIDVWDADGFGPGGPRLVVNGRVQNTTGNPWVGISAFNNTTGNFDGVGKPLADSNADSFSRVTAMGIWDIVGTGIQPQWLFAGGTFTRDNYPNNILLDPPTTSLNHLAQINNMGPEWLTVPQLGPRCTTFPNSGSVAALFSISNMTVTNPNGIYIGGLFDYAGASPVNNITQYNGTSWSSIEGGLNGAVTSFGRFRVGTIVSPASMYIGGGFTAAGSTTLNHVARLSGGAVNGYTYNALGTGTNGTVSAILQCDPDGSGPLPQSVVMGGVFTTAGGISANRIAAWVPSTSSWVTFGSGMNGAVNALAFYDSDGSGPIPAKLIAGGTFTTASGIGINRLAAWDGIQWQPFEGGGVIGTGASVNALAVWPDPLDANHPRLVVGGNFTQVGSSPANDIAAYQNGQWITFGGGVSGNGVTSIALMDVNGANDDNPALNGPELFIGGSMTSNGSGGALKSLAIWRPDIASVFQPIGEIQAPPFPGGQNVLSLLPIGPAGANLPPRLMIGGRFDWGNFNTPYKNLAIWSSDQPYITSIPAPSNSVCPGSTVNFDVTVTGESLVYRWQRNGVNLFPGATGTGSVLTGVDTPHLTISNAGSADTGAYALNIFSPCGNARSLPSVLSMQSCCPADFNADGSADFFDYLDFVDSFSANSPAADFNHDGAIDFFDYLDFVDAFSAGC